MTPNEAHRLIHAAFDFGINFFDTADIYGQGDSERCLGAAFRSRRSEVVICTKAGYVLSTKARIASYAKPILKPILGLAKKLAPSGTNMQNRPSGWAMAQDFSTAHMLRSIDASLRRLRTEYIDLFLLHSPPVDGLRLERITEAVQSAKTAGKIRAFGVSSCSPDDLAAWSKWSSVDVIQVSFTVGNPAVVSLIQEATARGINIIAREVLSGSRVNLDDKGAIEDALRSALRVVNIVLIGTTNIKHLHDNVVATLA